MEMEKVELAPVVDAYYNIVLGASLSWKVNLNKLELDDEPNRTGEIKINKTKIYALVQHNKLQTTTINNW